MKNFNKIAFGMLFYGAATLFVYFLISFCTTIGTVDNYFIPTMNMVYAMICLSISIITQVKFLKSEDSQTSLILGVINIIAYLLVLVVAIYINVGGLKTNKQQFIAAAIGLYIYSGIELLCGFGQIARSIKQNKEVEENKNN